MALQNYTELIFLHEKIKFVNKYEGVALVTDLFLAMSPGVTLI